MSALTPHAIFNCVVGADQVGPQFGTGDSVLNLLGANLTAAAAVVALTVFDGAAAGNIILLTLAAPINGNAGGVFPSNYSVQSKANGLHYTLSGVGATAQIYWQTG